MTRTPRPDPGRPLPPQDLDDSRLDAARRRREAEGEGEGEPSLGDEAIAHAQTIPPHHEPGGHEAELNSGRINPNGEKIVQSSAKSAGSTAQTGKPMPPKGRARHDRDA